MVLERQGYRAAPTVAIAREDRAFGAYFSASGTYGTRETLFADRRYVILTS